MKSEVSVSVPSNPLQDLIFQIQERENLILQKISEIEALREKLLIFIFFSSLFVFIFTVFNFYFLFKWKKFLSTVKVNPKNFSSGRKKTQLEKGKEKKLLFSFCSRKNCLFFRQNKNCQLAEFAQKLINFSHSLCRFWENKFLLEKMINLSNELNKTVNENCAFFQNQFLKKNQTILKIKLKKIRHILNKIKKEKNLPSKVKREASFLWKINHKLSLKLRNF